MSYVPDLDANGMLSSLGSTIANNVKQYRQKQLLSELGKDLMGGDYQSAASKALAAGDMQTGLKLMELHQQRQNAAALPGLLQGPSFGQQQQAAPQQTGDGSGGDYFKKLAAVESGGNPNAVSPTGAKGVFQFIPSTWKQYGGGADVMDPNAQFVAVQRLTADNRSALASALGREPTAGELYLAHQQGAGGAIKLLSNPGATPAELGLGRNVAVNGGNPNAPAGQFVQKWTSKFDGVGSPLAFGARDQATAPANVAYARPAAAPAASSEDDGEEDRPAAGAQLAQGAVPAVPGATPAKSTKSDDSENTAKIAALRDYQTKLTTALATVTGEGPKAAITARLTQVQKQLDDLKPDKEKFQIIKNEDGSITAVNKTDPSQFQNIQIGKPKSQAEYDTRKVLADDMGLSGSARTGFLANGKIPDQIRVLRSGDQAIGPTGEIIAKNEGGGANGTISDENADFLAERVVAGDKQALVGLGRGAQGANNLAKVQQMVAQKAKERGLDAGDILYNQAKQVGATQEQRTFGNQTARMSTSSVEAQGAITLGRQASELVPRGNWVPVNKAIQLYQANTSSPELGKFAAANLAIINTYARAINPNGQPTVADKEHASHMLNTATSQKQYNAVLDQMQQEIDMAHNSPAIAKRGLENIRKGKPFMDGISDQEIFGHGGGAGAPKSTNGGTTKSGIKWSIE